jgi:hypothetical protein
MTELANEKRGIRFKKDFAFYDHSRSQMWRSWSAGEIVDDPFEWLTNLGAPVKQTIFRR